MEDATYRDMTEEYLGSEATADDLAAFVTACARYQERTGCTDACLLYTSPSPRD